MSKIIKYITITLLILIFGWFIYQVVSIVAENRNATPDKIIEPSTGTNIILTGDTLTPSSGTSMVTGEKHDIENFQSMIDKGNFISFRFPNQPPDGSTSYSERSKILNEYLKNNNRYFSIDTTINTGYFYIKTKKPAEEIFLYRHNTERRGGGYPISGKLRIGESLGTYSSREYLYSLKNIPIKTFYQQKSYSLNRQNIINTLKTSYIGGYVVSFDGNKIEEIIITRE